jgi:hypothetical protein
VKVEYGEPNVGAAVKYYWVLSGNVHGVMTGQNHVLECEREGIYVGGRYRAPKEPWPDGHAEAGK